MKTFTQLRAALEAGHVTRFHTRRVVHPQNVAAHSANVALIAYALSDGRPSAELLMACLTHDLEERWTGDIPAPVKWASPVLDAELFRLAADWKHQHTGLETFPLTKLEERILKAADSIDGAMYCHFELMSGSRVLLPTLERYCSVLEAYEDFPLAAATAAFLKKEHLNDRQ